MAMGKSLNRNFFGTLFGKSCLLAIFQNRGIVFLYASIEGFVVGLESILKKQDSNKKMNIIICYY
jgi:hypothetical protein